MAEEQVQNEKWPLHFWPINTPNPGKEAYRNQTRGRLLKQPVLELPGAKERHSSRQRRLCKSRLPGGGGREMPLDGQSRQKMDPDISLLFQCPSPKGITEAQVRAELSPLYDRRQLPGDKARIETAWVARRQKSPWLFDGTKFRLHSIQLEGDILTFCLGLTCYKDFVGTNLADAAGQLQKRGREDLGNSQAYLAEPLGVGAMLHTADDKFVFLRRSHCVGEAPGKIDIPGGHPEPQVVMGDAALEGPVHHQDLPGESVVKELFCSVLREIQDEVNLPLPTLSSPLLLGIARNETSAGRCSAEFYIRCSLNSEQVRYHYAIGGPEAQESTSIIFVDRGDVLTLEQSGDFWKELCPSAKGAIELYRGVMGTCQ